MIIYALAPQHLSKLLISVTNIKLTNIAFTMWLLSILTLQMCHIYFVSTATKIQGNPGRRKPNTVIRRGSPSSTRDDAESRATCPENHVVTHCEVETGLVQTRSDGVFVDPDQNGTVCVAFNAGGYPPTVALAECSRDGRVSDPCNNDGPTLPKFVNLHSRGPSPRVSCPPGYQQTVCNARSKWLGRLRNKGVNSKGIIPNGNACAVADCTERNWCEVTAVCKIIENAEKYKDAVCPPIVTKRGPRSGTWDDAESRATCPENHVVTHCEVETGLVQTRSDGVFVDPDQNGTVCVAFNAGGYPPTVALAECSRDGRVSDPCSNDGPTLPKFVNLHSRGPSPRVSCPPGYLQTVCNARSKWLGRLRNKGVNSKGIIPNGNACAVSDCTERNWCEVTAVCKIIENSKNYKDAVCPPIVIRRGSPSSTRDDAESRATCPENHVVTHCEVETGLVQTRSDGVFVDPDQNGTVCVAFNAGGYPPTVALAECSRDGRVSHPCNSDGPTLPKFVNLHSRGPSPRVSCPPGYQQTVCNARSKWLGRLRNKGVNSKGIIPNGNACAVSDCTERNWCEVTAVCKIIENAEKYRDAVCPPIVTKRGPRSGTWDDAESRATCPENHVVTHCEVETGLVQTRSDGVFVDPDQNGRVCVAFNAGGYPPTVALAECSRDGRVSDPCSNDGPTLPKFVNLHSRGPSPRVSCPPRYLQTVCNARSKWLGRLRNKGVNSKGIIPNGNACAVSDCTERNWCEVTAVCKIIENSKKYKDAVCPPIVIRRGSPSSTRDDAESRATCPENHVVTHCEVETGLVQTRSDGVFVDPDQNGTVCVAFNAGGYPPTVALAECSRDGRVSHPCNSDGPTLPKFVNLHSRGPSPRVSCPPGYQQTVCNARSKWLGRLRNKGVNSKGIIPNGNACAVSDCTERNWCEVTAVCKIIENAKKYKDAVCPPIVIRRGSPSSTRDDAESRAACPENHIVTHCEVETGLVQTRSDGVFVDPDQNGTVCVAFNAGGYPPTVALAECSRDGRVSDPCNNDGPTLPKFVNLHSRGPSPRVSCPPGYQQTVCNARSKWLGRLRNKGVNSKGIIPNGNACAVSDCTERNWCEVTAVCKIIENAEKYKDAVCPPIVTKRGPRSGTWDDAESRATCPENHVVTHCEVETGLVQTRSDGVFVDPDQNGTVCVAFNAGGYPPTVALAECSRDGRVSDPCNNDGPTLPKFVNLHSRGPSPRVSCPPGYLQTVCNARSKWLGRLRNKGVNSKGIIPNGNVCAVSDCTERNWCEVTAVCKIIENSKKYKDAVCPPIVIRRGSPSSTRDDAESRAACPENHVVTHCEVETGLVQTRSDGVFVDPDQNGTVCVAFNAGGYPPTVALAECSRDGRVSDPCNNDGPTQPKFVNLHSRGPSPRVSCPPGYLQTVCNARSKWLGRLRNKGVNSKGIIPNGNACAVSDCTERNWCEVTAVCKIIENAEKYKIAACPERR